jgi:hypothetical protein
MACKQAENIPVMLWWHVAMQSLVKIAEVSVGQKMVELCRDAESFGIVVLQSFEQTICQWEILGHGKVTWSGE